MMSRIHQVLKASPEIHVHAIAPEAWEGLAGMTPLKQLLERRVLLPLRERARARKHGLTPPGAMLLFGPPGTGKTALAHVIAGRLGWAFVDVDLSTVAADAIRLRRLFERLFQLEQAVIFFDEFEHLGLKRDSQVTQLEPLTAELLRGVPALRKSGEVLVVCATNHVRLLDPALLRPGRFDLVLPVGWPERADRAALLRQLLARHQCGSLDLDRIVARTERFTAADLEAVCQAAARAAFEREVHAGQDSCVQTADVLRAIERLRPTLSADQASAFEEDRSRFART